MSGIHILGTGRCIPEKIVTNDDISKLTDTNDEWISTRTGIRQRHFVQGESNADLATAAARKAMERAGAKPEEIGACVVATFTPDHMSPAVATQVQHRLSLPEDCPSFDISVGCTGFLYGLSVVRGLLLQSGYSRALLIGSEVISKVLDFGDRSTCVLFGDGAGAAVIELSDDYTFTSVLGCRGDDTLLGCTNESGAERHRIFMNGSEVFRFAVETVPRSIEESLQKAQLSADQIDYFVCHQANQRIISSAIRKTHLPEEKFYINVHNYGNTSAASIPIALDEMAEQGMLAPGTRTLCVGFGAGLTWGSAILEW